MTVAAIFEGILTGHELNVSYTEDTVQRHGRRWVAPALIQTLSVHATLELAQNVFESLGKERTFPFKPVKYALLLLPSLAAVASNRSRIFSYLHNQTSFLCLLAFTVSSVALIALGQTALGGAALGMVVIGVLNRARLMPYPMRSCFNNNSFLIANIPLFFLEGFYKKIYATLEIALNILNLWSGSQLEKRIASLQKPARIDPNQPLTLDQVEISDHHLLDAEYSIPEIEWDGRLVPLFETINCFQDGREAIRKGLINIENRAFIGSEPKEYETLWNKLGHIAAFLKEAEDVKKAAILRRLGLAAHGYSGKVVWQVDAIYAQEVTSKECLKYALQKCRDQIFERTIQRHFTAKIAYPFLKYSWLSPIAKIVQDFLEPKDIHTYYLYVNTLAPDFSLTHALGAKTDQMAMSDALVELFLKLYNHRAVREIDAAYSKEVILDVASRNMENQATLIADLVNKGVFRLKS